MDARQVPGFLIDPGPCRLVLLYGDDEGLIRERCQALTRQVAGCLNDPFRVTELVRDGWAQIPGEVAALSMVGGRRVVIVRDAAEATLGPAVLALKGPGGALLILEAAGIGRGKLRSFAENAADCAAIGCYPDEGRGLAELIRAGLAELKVSIEPEALVWLSQVTGGDRAVLRSDIEKLALLAGRGGIVDYEVARLCVGGQAAGGIDEGLLAALCGDVEQADKLIETALQDGFNGVTLLRMAVIQIQRLHQARLKADAGLSVTEAIRTIRPPVFYRAVAATTTCLTHWSGGGLLRMLEEARLVELATKQTGSRPDVLARRFVASLARHARSRQSIAA